MIAGISRNKSLAYRSVSRCLNTTGTSSSPDTNTRDQLRALLRETAQPVAVVTCAMLPSLSKDTRSQYHGATLSSFTSIALDPYPLVTFSLRMPSRMATSLKSASPHLPSHMVINILSAAQESAAIAFSRPDIHREPFSTVPYCLSEDGLPILKGSLGAVSCKLISRTLPLHDLDFLEKGSRTAAEQKLKGTSSIASELFIAQVVRVEECPQEDQNHLRLPLLYHRKGFTSCDTPPHSKPKT
jgi:flavin reductase (DIM6/NTAB) family NADH-FMN oxidoreductase RutF